MLINEVCKGTNLTKKAIEYYTQKGLVFPQVLGNGYRDYKEEDVETLKRIHVLRKLGMGMEDIREILQDGSGEALQKAAARKELETRRDVRKNQLLRELGSGKAFSEVEGELQVLEVDQTIGEKLLKAFPGYYGRFVCLHFSRFLDEPIRTGEQQAAYETVLSFLDEMPSFVIPEDVEEQMAEAVKAISTEQIGNILENVKQSVEEPEDFLEKNQETIEWYLAYRETEEYKESAAGKWMEYMRAFQNVSGYTEIFLSAMKRLSPSYKEYCIQMDRANEKFLERYPAAERLIK